MNENTSNRAIPWLVLFSGIACISVSAIFVKEAQVNGISSAFYRIAIALLCITPFYIRTENKGMRGAEIAICLVGGMFFAFELVFWNMAVIISNATFPTLVVNLSSIWVGIGAMALFREKLNRFHWIGNGIALLGIAVLIGVPNIVQMEVERGFVFSIIGSIFLAFYVLAVKRVRGKNSTLQVVFFTLLGSLLTLAICCRATGSALHGFSPTSWLYLLGLGIITQLGGYFLINFSLGHIDSAKVSLCTLLQPILTAILAVLILKETFALHQLIGGVLVLAGLMVAITINERSLCSEAEG